MAADESFALWWKAYPRRVKRGLAFKVWMKLKPDAELLDRMLTALEWQKIEWARDDVRYVPHPTSWLNQERWTDEPMQPLPEPDRETWTQWKKKNLTH